MLKKSLAVGIILFLVISSVPYSTLSNKISTSTFSGNTLYVGGTGPGNYSKIQDAIDNASDGDTIYVYSSLYYENVVIDKSINLIGENRDSTVIDAPSNGSVVNITADLVNIYSFTIQNSRNIYSSGIEINSNYSNISNNIISNNGSTGINLVNSSSNIISNNIICLNTHWGIYIKYSNNNSVLNNNISNNNVGIVIVHSDCNSISGNALLDSDFVVVSSYNNTVTNNTINGKSLIYLEQESDVVIDYNAGKIILINCDNIIIQNQNLSNPLFCGIQLESTSNCHIRNNTIFNGILVLNSHNNIISDNNFIGDGSFIGIDYSTGNNISGNYFYNSVGLVLTFSPETIISDNIISNTVVGLILLLSNDCTVEGNTISNSEWWGILLACNVNDKSRFCHNNFINNSRHAMFAISSEDFMENPPDIFPKNYYNIIVKNHKHISLRSRYKNLIQPMGNSFISNFVFSRWNGNYWDNWLGIGPKMIFGGKEFIVGGLRISIPWFNFDWHPAKEPYDIPAGGA